MLWPQGFGGTFDWASALIALAAATALFRFGRGVMEVVAVTDSPAATLAVSTAFTVAWPEASVATLA